MCSPAGAAPVKCEREAAAVVRGDSAQRLAGHDRRDRQRLRRLPPAHRAVQQLRHALPRQEADWQGCATRVLDANDSAISPVPSLEQAKCMCSLDRWVASAALLVHCAEDLVTKFLLRGSPLLASGCLAHLQRICGERAPCARSRQGRGGCARGARALRRCRRAVCRGSALLLPRVGEHALALRHHPIHGCHLHGKPSS